MSRSIPSWLVRGLFGATSSSPATGAGFAPLKSARQAFHEAGSLGTEPKWRPFRPFRSISHISATSLQLNNRRDSHFRLEAASRIYPTLRPNVSITHQIIRYRSGFPVLKALQPSRRLYSNTGGSSRNAPQSRKPENDEGKATETPKAGASSEASTPNPGGESESIAASVSKYLHLPKMPHRPTKEELLAAANGFWERVRVRFKWMSIRSMRPWNADEWGAFVSWFMLGHIVWILVGTTTFFSLLIFSINTVFAQGIYPRRFQLVVIDSNLQQKR